MKRLFAALLISAGVTEAAQAQAVDPFVGQIMITAADFCPVGWLPTDGQVVPISMSYALFSLLGTHYGGDGLSTFGLPKTQPIFTQNRFPLQECIAYQGVFPPHP